MERYIIEACYWEITNIHFTFYAIIWTHKEEEDVQGENFFALVLYKNDDPRQAKEYLTFSGILFWVKEKIRDMEDYCLFVDPSFKHLKKNHRKIGIERDIEDHLVTNTLLWTGPPPTVPGCSALAVWPWTPLGTRHPQLLRASTSTASSHSQQGASF